MRHKTKWRSYETSIVNAVRWIVRDLPIGAKCGDCKYRKVDKCNLFCDYLSVSEEGYKKKNVCYDLVAFTKGDHDDNKLCNS